MSSTVQHDAIGGYFELAYPEEGGLVHPAAQSLQSARAALHALVQKIRPSRVWMPYYICDAMLAPLHALGVDIAYYPIDEHLQVSGSVELGAKDCLLYVNYFGICNEQADALLHRFPPEQVILDHSQAFFCKPRNCLATIYSPRKFFGLPDGGLLVSEIRVDDLLLPEDDSLTRTIPLLKRLADGPQAGYAAFQAAEASLTDTRPRAMSRLTRRLFQGIDITHAHARRNENFRILHEHLGHLNSLDVNLDSMDGPLCYPFLNGCEGLRDKLIRARIYAATYWPEVLARSALAPVEGMMVRHCVPLPCDQRYGRTEMERIVANVLRHL